MSDRERAADHKADLPAANECHNCGADVPEPDETIGLCEQCYDGELGILMRRAIQEAPPWVGEDR